MRETFLNEANTIADEECGRQRKMAEYGAALIEGR